MPDRKSAELAAGSVLYEESGKGESIVFVQLKEVLPDARLQVMPGARTFVAEYQPRLLSDAIADFCASTQ